MKKYRFPHERILALRRLEAEMIRVRMEHQAAEVRKQEEFRREIARQAKESAMAARQSGVTGMELIGAENFGRYASRADAMVAEQQRRSVAQLQKEHQLLIAAERKAKVFEKLDEAGRARWRKALAHEVEQFAAEAYLARWRPRQTPEVPDLET